METMSRKYVSLTIKYHKQIDVFCATAGNTGVQVHVKSRKCIIQ
jgi:hypothetical protein